MAALTPAAALATLPAHAPMAPPAGRGGVLIPPMSFFPPVCPPHHLGTPLPGPWMTPHPPVADVPLGVPAQASPPPCSLPLHLFAGLGLGAACAGLECDVAPTPDPHTLPFPLPPEGGTVSLPFCVVPQQPLYAHGGAAAAPSPPSPPPAAGPPPTPAAPPCCAPPPPPLAVVASIAPPSATGEPLSHNPPSLHSTDVSV